MSGTANQVDSGTLYWIRHLEAKLRRWTADIDAHAERLRKAHYDPNEPRVPAGSSDGGQWTGTGGGGRYGGAIRRPRRNPLVRRVSDDEEEEVLSPYTTHPYSPMRNLYPPVLKPTRPNIGLTETELEVEKVRGTQGTDIHIEAARKIPQDITKVSKGEDNLTSGQQLSLKKFKAERSRYEGGVDITNYSDGRAIFSVKKPADKIPGSYAVWETQVDASGKTIRRYKTSIGPNGEFIHTKVYYEADKE